MDSNELTEDLIVVTNLASNFTLWEFFASPLV